MSIGQILICNKCEIAIHNKHRIIYAPVPLPKKVNILFVGEAPGATEHICKEVFVGPAGDLIRDIAAEACPKATIAFTNSIYCVPFVDDALDLVRKPFLKEVQACSNHLKRMIKLIDPDKIVALGKEAAKAVIATEVSDLLTIPHPRNILSSTHIALEQKRTILKLRQYMES